MKISKMIQRWTSGFLAAGILLFLIPAGAVHADETIGISVSGNTEAGAQITASVSVKGGGPYSGFNGSFSFDSSYLELTSISAGNYSVANFSKSGANFTEYNANIPGGAVIVVATFTCKAAGSSSISCNLDALGDMNGVDISASTSTTVNITAPVPKSGNADLASLAISPGTLTPAFSAGTQSYSASVSAEQSKITVAATPADPKSSVALNGVQNSLLAGKNTVKVTVTAENGTSKVYTITVTRASGPTPTPAPTPVPLPLMKYNEDSLTILTAGPNDAIPAGFSASTAKYQGVDIPVLQKSVGDAAKPFVITLVLLAGDTRTSYYVYDAVSEICYPYQLISSAALNFQILDKTAAPSVPDGYEAFDYVYQENQVTAYRLLSDPENPQLLLYLMDDLGKADFYYYDTENALLMLYRGEVTILAATPAPTPEPTATPATTEVIIPPAAAALPIAESSGLTFSSLLDYTNPVVMLVYLLALFCLILLIVCIVLIARRGRVYEGDEYDPDPDYENEKPLDLDFTEPSAVPKPVDYFNDFGNTHTEPNLFFGDAPKAEPIVLDFPVIRQQPTVTTPAFQPGKKTAGNNNDINKSNDTTNTSFIAVQSDSQVVQDIPARPVQPVEHIPVRLQKALDAERAQNISSPLRTQSPAVKTSVDDPDFDPDD